MYAVESRLSPTNRMKHGYCIEWYRGCFLEAFQTAEQGADVLSSQGFGDGPTKADVGRYGEGKDASEEGEKEQFFEASSDKSAAHMVPR